MTEDKSDGMQVIDADSRLVMLTVDFSKLVSPPKPLQFIIMLDKSLAEILAFSDKNPMTFIAPIYTGAPEAVPDFSLLKESDQNCPYIPRDPRASYIFSPLYVGNVDNDEAAIAAAREYFHAAVAATLLSEVTPG